MSNSTPTPSGKRYEEAVEEVEILLRNRQPQLNVTYPFDEEAREAVETAYPHIFRDAIEQAAEVLRGASQARRGKPRLTGDDWADFLLQHFGVTPTEEGDG